LFICYLFVCLLFVICYLFDLFICLFVICYLLFVICLFVCLFVICYLFICYLLFVCLYLLFVYLLFVYLLFVYLLFVTNPNGTFQMQPRNTKSLPLRTVWKHLEPRFVDPANRRIGALRLTGLLRGVHLGLGLCVARLLALQQFHNHGNCNSKEDYKDRYHVHILVLRVALCELHWLSVDLAVSAADDRCDPEKPFARGNSSVPSAGLCCYVFLI